MKTMIKALMPLLLLLAVGSIAHAQATRTWVSGVGDDANPCSRTAPCKTFAGAYSKTATGGEIDALDPGGFGTINIGHAITIDGGGGQVASVLAASSFPTGISVTAPAGSVVLLRNLSINGISQTATAGSTGINITNGASVVVEHCNIMNFHTEGISDNVTAGGSLSVLDTTITNTGIGVQVTGSGNVNLLTSLRNVSIKLCTDGIDAAFGTLDVSNSIITQNSGFGMHTTGGSITSIGCILTGNGTAIQAETNSAIRLISDEIYSNTTAFGSGGGTIYSAGNNHKGGAAPAITPTPITTF